MKLFPSLSVHRNQTPADQNDRAATMVEYILLIAIISMVSIAVIRIVGLAVSAKFYEIEAELAGN